MVSTHIFPGQYPRRMESMLLVCAILLNIAGFLSLEASLTNNVVKRREQRALRRGIDSETYERTQSLPVALRIPAINLDAPIVQVGLRPDGLMDIPETAHEVGWFSLGFLPGLPGNAVMAGHVDQASGLPAIFWNLRQVQKGDIVEVIRMDGTIIKFRVTGRTTYPANAAPMEDLFGSSTGSYLNLITCNGSWNSALQTYDRRLVVYAEVLPSSL